jgi:hypothetical protein
MTSPGSPMVARLYEHMGFTEPGSKSPFHRKPLTWLLEQIPVVTEFVDAVTLVKKERNVQEQIERGEDPNYLMALDLTNPVAVRQALVAFSLSRRGLSDVPKDVAEKMAAAGMKAPKPNRAQWAKDLSEDFSNVRVIRPKDC